MFMSAPPFYIWHFCRGGGGANDTLRCDQFKPLGQMRSAAGNVKSIF